MGRESVGVLKGEQRGQYAVGCDAEYRAAAERSVEVGGAERPAGGGGSAHDAIGAQRQSGYRISACRVIIERSQTVEIAPLVVTLNTDPKSIDPPYSDAQ